ncbi:porin family protein [Winogradskyella echinorum]|uniref:Porin family protein n=1 Tax=Winogradskyella echinorum TaxID=538189 RepID=A0ABR6Y6R9_9FLAO|nr:porin family protein [Winogradskyella echinorum]MBC3847953.1 porin family protein [Winogradskyella echinorum]MBC5752301.1 porin family protein [Winogradskyella echinorum]
MKRYLFVLFLVAFTTVSLSQEVRYGVRGALNVSNLDFDPSPTIDNQHRNGFAFGGFVEYGFSEEVSLLTELQWSAEGGKEEAIRADYLKLPVQLRFSVSERFTLGAGPQLALKTWKDSDGFATFVFSGVAGAEYMITDELFVDARVHYGFSNILDEDITDIKVKNHVIQFGFGIKI